MYYLFKVIAVKWIWAYSSIFRIIVISLNMHHSVNIIKWFYRVVQNHSKAHEPLRYTTRRSGIKRHYHLQKKKKIKEGRKDNVQNGWKTILNSKSFFTYF